MNSRKRATSIFGVTLSLLAMLIGIILPSYSSAAADQDKDEGKAGKPNPANMVMVKDQQLAKNKEKAIYNKMPMRFELNQGQVGNLDVRFFASNNEGSIFVAGNEVVLEMPEPKAERSGRPPWAGHDDEDQMHAEHARKGGKPAWANSEREFKPETKEPMLALRMSLAGANQNVKITGEDRFTGKVNRYIGKDPKNWRTDIPMFAKVRYESVYPGIDAVYYGDQNKLEYDFVVAPGASPKAIAMNFTGPNKIKIDEDGNLILKLQGKDVAKEITQNKPNIYQDINGARRAVKGGYVIKSPAQVGFEVGEYDTTKPLVIDPPLIYSTYLGGTGKDQAFGIAVDSQGNAVVTGKTRSVDFPTKGAQNGALVKNTNCTGLQPGGGTGTFDECVEPHWVFITKFKADGSDIIFSTVMGGTRDDRGNAIDVDGCDNTFVAGQTLSPDFPTVNAIQPNFASVSIEGINNESDAGNCDAFFVKVDTNGQLVMSSYWGGEHDDRAFGIRVSPDSSSFVIVGKTDSETFPVSAKAIQNKITSPQFFGHGGHGGDDFYPPDAFIAKFTFNGTGGVGGGGQSNGGSGIGYALTYSTYLGGRSVDVAYGVDIDAAGAAYVTGRTSSRAAPLPAGGMYGGFPTSANAYNKNLNSDAPPEPTLEDQATEAGSDSDADPCCDVGSDVFVSKISGDGSTLVYSTLFGASDGNVPKGVGQNGVNGGEPMDFGYAIRVDAQGNVYVTGATGNGNENNPFNPSHPFPTTDGSTRVGGENDAYLTKFNSDGSALLFSTVFGSSGEDVAHGLDIDSAGNAYVVGTSEPENKNNDGNTIGDFHTKDAVLTGTLTSGNLVANGSSLANTQHGGEDIFLTVFSPTGSTLLDILIGGGTGPGRSSGVSEDTGRSIRLDKSNNIYITGGTKNANFPVTTGAYSTTFHPGGDAQGPGEDAYVMKIGAVVAPAVVVGKPTSSVQPQTITFDICVKDNTTGNLVQFSSTTGAYKFTRCSDQFMLTGTGVITRPNGTIMLTDRKADRNISIGWNPGSKTGGGTVSLLASGTSQTIRINDTNPNATCNCAIGGTGGGSVANTSCTQHK
jgi:hypothetical protein